MIFFHLWVPIRLAVTIFSTVNLFCIFLIAPTHVNQYLEKKDDYVHFKKTSFCFTAKDFGAEKPHETFV